jgi:hypothetical protein
LVPLVKHKKPFRGFNMLGQSGSATGRRQRLSARPIPRSWGSLSYGSGRCSPTSPAMVSVIGTR